MCAPPFGVSGAPRRSQTPGAPPFGVSGAPRRMLIRSLKELRERFRLQSSEHQSPRRIQKGGAPGGKGSGYAHISGGERFSYIFCADKIIRFVENYKYQKTSCILNIDFKTKTDPSEVGGTPARYLLPTRVHRVPNHRPKLAHDPREHQRS